MDGFVHEQGIEQGILTGARGRVTAAPADETERTPETRATPRFPARPSPMAANVFHKTCG
jgi:hypothetical protein